MDISTVPAVWLLFLQAMKTAMHIAATRTSEPPPAQRGYVAHDKKRSGSEQGNERAGKRVQDAEKDAEQDAEEAKFSPSDLLPQR